MNNKCFQLKMLEMGDLLFQKYQDSQIKIKEHFQLILGKTPSTKNPEYYENGTLPWINSGALTNWKNTPWNRLITEKAKRECNLEYTKENSVLVSLIGLNSQKIIWCRKQVLFNQSIINLISNSPQKNATLFFALRQIDFSIHSQGCVFPALNKQTLLNMKIDWISDSNKQKHFLTLLNDEFLNIESKAKASRLLNNETK